jgi:DNA-binding transcriptional ArsR family regulator
MAQQALAVISDAEAAAAALQPARLKILDALRDPDSAAGVARRLGLPRQRVGYHLRELEKRGFVQHIEDRKRGNCVERIVQATARHYLVAPQALGPVAADPAAVQDRFSSAYLIAVTARTLREAAELQEKARLAGKKLPTLTVQTDVRFRDAAGQNAFAEELSRAMAVLAAKYHDETSSHGRSFRFTLTGHPAIPRTDDTEAP